MDIKLYNTLTHEKDKFIPIKKNEVSIYTCGPTVYGYAHIGNMRAYIFMDNLRRMFKYNGYKTKHVMNLTDVGHLTSDADSGEDKMEKAAKREGKNPWDIAAFYIDAFMKDIDSLNVDRPEIITRATDNIPEMLEMMIVQYNASRRKFIEDSQKKIRLEVQRDDLQLRMKRITILICNKGTASTGKMNIFIDIPECIKLYWDTSKKKVDYDEPSTPTFHPYLKAIPSVSIYTPKIEMWDMVDYIRDDQLKKTFEPLNHKLQQGLFTLYVDSATCPNFKLKWILVDAELSDPVKGELNVSFVEE